MYLYECKTIDFKIDGFDSLPADADRLQRKSFTSRTRTNEKLQVNSNNYTTSFAWYCFNGSCLLSDWITRRIGHMYSISSRRLRSFRWKGRSNETYYIYPNYHSFGLSRILLWKTFQEFCSVVARIHDDLLIFLVCYLVDWTSNERLQSWKNVPEGLCDAWRCTCLSEYRGCTASGDTTSSNFSLITFLNF